MCKYSPCPFIGHKSSAFTTAEERKSRHTISKPNCLQWSLLQTEISLFCSLTWQQTDQHCILGNHGVSMTYLVLVKIMQKHIFRIPLIKGCSGTLNKISYSEPGQLLLTSWLQKVTKSHFCGRCTRQIQSFCCRLTVCLRFPFAWHAVFNWRFKALPEHFLTKTQAKVNGECTQHYPSFPRNCTWMNHVGKRKAKDRTFFWHKKGEREQF